MSQLDVLDTPVMGPVPLSPLNMPADQYCTRCGNLVHCTCSLAKRHAPTCRFLRAATLSVELACDHGFQACPVCDPCDCGAGQAMGTK
jgi:hypothetical protein